MKAKGKKSGGGLLTIGMFIVAAALLISSAAGSSRAALTYFSETYGAEVSMYDIGVSLVENKAIISNRDYNSALLGDNWHENTGKLVAGMVPSGEDLKLDHAYDEVLAVENTGTIDEYVRVTIYRYWVDENNKKLLDLSPSLIDLNLLTGGKWTLDKNATTTERTVLYYKEVLPAGATSDPFSDTLTIRQADGMTAGMRAKVTTSETVDAEGRRVITTTYDYEGIQFVLRVDVDAVQTHNAADAIRSAWGVEMSAYGIR